MLTGAFRHKHNKMPAIDAFQLRTHVLNMRSVIRCGDISVMEQVTVNTFFLALDCTHIPNRMLNTFVSCDLPFTVQTKHLVERVSLVMWNRHVKLIAKIQRWWRSRDVTQFHTKSKDVFNLTARMFCRIQNHPELREEICAGMVQCVMLQMGTASAKQARAFVFEEDPSLCNTITKTMQKFQVVPKIKRNTAASKIQRLI